MITSQNFKNSYFSFLLSTHIRCRCLRDIHKIVYNFWVFDEMSAPVCVVKWKLLAFQTYFVRKVFRRSVIQNYGGLGWGLPNRLPSLGLSLESFLESVGQQSGAFRETCRVYKHLLGYFKSEFLTHDRKKVFNVNSKCQNWITIYKEKNWNCLMSTFQNCEIP